MKKGTAMIVLDTKSKDMDLCIKVGNLTLDKVKTDYKVDSFYVTDDMHVTFILICDEHLKVTLFNEVKQWWYYYHDIYM